MSSHQIGLCGWNGSQPSYFEQFSCIEIQTTFYDPPSASVGLRWRRNAPPGFEFCIKAWQLITHPASSPTYRRLRKPLPDSDLPLVGGFQATAPVREAWLRTLEIAQGVDASVILFQCPKSFLPTSANLIQLASFFDRIERGGFRIAWEPRGEAWHDDLVRELCQQYNLVHCVDPLTTTPSHGDWIYWRLHGLDGYSYQYTDADLARLRRLLLASGKPGYVMFNNFSSKNDALRFKETLEISVDSIREG